MRIGNAAHTQRQTDIFGEIIDAFYSAQLYGIEPEDDAQHVQKVLLEFLETHWHCPIPASGKFAARERRNTHSAVMAWVAFDRAIKSAERYRSEGPDRALDRAPRRDPSPVCTYGVDHDRGVFVQVLAARRSMPRCCASRWSDFCRRMISASSPPRTRRARTHRGRLRLALSPEEAPDGLPHNEGAFLICSFWLADNFALMGREKEARALFERLLDIRNDVGLLAEEYDPVEKRFLGNFPQAFSHVGLINTAHNLSLSKGPADRRAAH